MPQTGWISTLRDRTDNVLVISPGDLNSLNNEEFEAGKPWYDDMFASSFGGREGNYFIQQVLGGTDPNAASGADACAWQHAIVGDEDNQTWNGSTTEADDTSEPVCRPIPTGDADPATLGVSFALDYDPTGGIFSGASMRGRTRMSGGALWFLAVRAGLMSGPNWQRGVLGLNLLDPEADGVPAEFASVAELQWEGDLELIKAEVTGDVSGRPALGTVAAGMGATFFLNDAIQPNWTGAAFEDHWQLGEPGISPDGTGRPFEVFTYYDGDPVWLELANIGGWEDCADITAGENADLTYGICMSQVVEGLPGVDTSGSFAGELAVRFTFRSPRYRWVWGSDAATRQWSRGPDSLGLSSGGRIWPAPQSGRIFGGQQ